MNSLSKEKQTQLILIAVATVAIVIALWYFVMTAQNSAMHKYEVSIRDVKDRINRADIRIKRAASVQAEVADLRGQIAEAEAKMIPVEELNGKRWLFDTLVNFISGKYDVTPINLSNNGKIGKELLPLPKFAYAAAAYDVELRAFYHSFGKFLADFENAFPYISIQKLQLSPIATPSAATGPVADVPDELATGVEREQLRISMKVVVLFKPTGSL